MDESTLGYMIGATLRNKGGTFQAPEKSVADQAKEIMDKFYKADRDNWKSKRSPVFDRPGYWEDLQSQFKQKPNLFGYNESKQVVSSLMTIGGAKSEMHKNPLISLQAKANEHLATLVRYARVDKQLNW